MSRSKFLIFMGSILAVAVLVWSSGDALAQKKATKDEVFKKLGKVTPSEQKAAAKRAAKAGLKPGVAGLGPQAGSTPLPGIEGPGGVPHYFGPYGNWAFSPLPKGSIGSITVDSPGTGYVQETTVVAIEDVYGTGSGASASATVVNGAITAINVDSPGVNYSAPIVTITDSSGGIDAAATPILTNLTGGLRKFVDKMPGLGPASANALGQFIPVAVPQSVTYSGQEADYYEIALVEFSEKMHSDLPNPTRQRGYVQIVPAGWTGTDLLGNNYNAVSLTTANGLTRNITIGGVQAYGASKPHFLGPLIVAKGRVHGIPNTNPTDPGYPKPVRIKFYNLLPTGPADGTGRRPGDLFIPVDETVPGAGYGPALPGTAGSKYTQNRATIHLHGNNTVWISDGNVHQWITPPNESTPYPKGVSVRNVPDMGTACDAPGSGCMTFFYTNAQSARLQFYHDHAMGITRLNVYAGEAAGYVITDAVEQDMINGTNYSGVNPGLLKVLPGVGIPLVIQDRTFVDADTIFAQDPTWNWGTGPRGPDGKITAAVTGDLWYPHVYMSVQNPWDLTGTNAFGRWHYGPWFNPPTPTCDPGAPEPVPGCIEVGAVPNEYYDPINAPWEPPFRPGVPNPSTPGESFLDTPIVNGTAYPYLEVEPKAYRFRILNAANDRFFNLQLYVAADKTTWTPGTGSDNPGSPATVCGSGANPADCTEVKMVPVSVAPENQYADTPSGIPDPATKGPDWILIGTEGGFMPKPIVVPQQPIGFNLDPAYFAFGIVNQYSLFLGSAERADVVVDFSRYAGRTLILYNDSPAPVPAGAAPYDYYTGSPNQMDSGGAPTTQPGYGPNTRTIMQIRVGTTVTTPTTDVTLANLEAVFAKTATKRGVFEVSQDPIIIPQAAYNSAYNNTFPTSAAEQYFQIADTEKTFRPINEDGQLQPPVTLPLEMKAMHDEMGGVYDTLFGRMSGMLGLSLPNSAIHVLIPYGLASPPVDLVKGSLEGTPIGVMPDGTQIWRIFHNGVDTHTIHTHLFHTQLINRVDQSGQIVGDPVSPIEYGWKDTFRVNPLEVTYLAMRPTVPTQSQVPFEVPDSVRLIDPTLPEGADLIPPPPAGWFDPAGNQIEPGIKNHFVNFGWEYVWHCHILSHEEMDMMHSLVFVVPPRPPSGLVATWNGSTGGNRRVTLNWIDQSSKETGFTVQRATDANFTLGLTTFPVGASAGTGSTVTYNDTTIANNTQYWYRVFAKGPVVGDTAVYPNSIGFPTMSADSVSNTAQVTVGTPPTTVPAAPTALAATVQAGPQVSLSWTDNANNETGFLVQRCTGSACTDFAQIAAVGPRTTGNATVTYVDTAVTFGNTYRYRVAAVNGAGSSAYTNIATASVPAIPPAPTDFTVSVVKANGPNYTATLNWASATNPTSFTIQRAGDRDFLTNLNTFTVAGTARSLTQTVTRNTVYYYRIRANNSLGGSSAWLNALPFPIRTGP
jgi:FtsP/CotA-like multicopper oxidase with cupredoxin domain